MGLERLIGMMCVDKLRQDLCKETFRFVFSPLKNDKNKMWICLMSEGFSFYIRCRCVSFCCCCFTCKCSGSFFSIQWYLEVFCYGLDRNDAAGSVWLFFSWKKNEFCVLFVRFCAADLEAGCFGYTAWKYRIIDCQDVSWARGSCWSRWILVDSDQAEAKIRFRVSLCLLIFSHVHKTGRDMTVTLEKLQLFPLNLNPSNTFKDARRWAASVKSVAVLVWGQLWSGGLAQAPEQRPGSTKSWGCRTMSCPRPPQCFWNDGGCFLTTCVFWELFHWIWSSSGSPVRLR